MLFIVGIDISLVVRGWQCVENNIVVVKTADVAHQGVTDERCGGALFYIGIECGKSVHFKQHIGGKVHLVEDGVALFSGVVIPIHQNEGRIGKILQGDGLPVLSVFVV